LRRRQRAPIGERAPQELLGDAETVDFGGVEEVHSGVQRGVHDLCGLRGVDEASEGVAAEPYD
jgi:hypothetical protein